jgi:hypothetical protein
LAGRTGIAHGVALALLGTTVLAAGCISGNDPVAAMAYGLEGNASLASMAGAHLDRVAASAASSSGGRESTTAEAEAVATGVGTIEALRSTAAAGLDPGASRGEAVVEGVVLLGGLVTADAVQAVATAGPAGASTEGSGFTRLRIQGMPVDAVPSSVTLDGMVVQFQVVEPTSTGVRITMIRVVSPDGASVRIAHAQAFAGAFTPAVACGEVTGSASILPGVLAVDSTARDGPGNANGFAAGRLFGPNLRAEAAGGHTSATLRAGEHRGFASVEVQGLESTGMVPFRVEGALLVAEAAVTSSGPSTSFDARIAELVVLNEPVATGPGSANVALSVGPGLTLVVNEQRTTTGPGTATAEGALLHLHGLLGGQAVDWAFGQVRAVASAC